MITGRAEEHALNLQRKKCKKSKTNTLREYEHGEKSYCFGTF